MIKRYWFFLRVAMYRAYYIYSLLRGNFVFNDKSKSIIIWVPMIFSPRYYIGDNFVQDMGLLKSLKSKGYDVTIYTKKDIGTFFGKTIFMHGIKETNVFGLYDYTKTQYMLLQQLEKQNNNVFMTSEEFLYWENKVFMYKQLEKFGVRIPSTTIYPLNNIKYDEIAYPTLVKEEHSCSSVGVFKVSSEDELKRLVLSARFQKENEYLILQELINMRKDLRVILVGDEIVLHYWRLNTEDEWKPTTTGNGTEVDFVFFPEKWKNWTIEQFNKIGITTGAFDICWNNDDLETEPYILEISPFYQPNPIPPQEFKDLKISYGDWKKSLNYKVNYHIDNFFRIKDIYVNQLIKNGKI